MLSNIKLFRSCLFSMLLAFSFASQAAVTLTMAVYPEGAGTVSPEAGEDSVSIGVSHKITATAASGYKFSRWRITPSCGCTGSIAEPYSSTTTIILYDNATATAWFEEIPVETVYMTMAVSPEAGGTCSPDLGTAQVPKGEAQTIEGTAANTYTFYGWTAEPAENASFSDSNSSKSTVTLTGDATVTATFMRSCDIVYYNVTEGSTFEFEASKLGKTSFDQKPKIYFSGGLLEKKKKNIKILTPSKDFKNKSVESILCEFKGKVKEGVYDLYLLEKGEKTPTAVGKISVRRPTKASLSPNKGATGDTITITGFYFGVKKPKIWLSYTDEKGKSKKKNCKILKPLKYANAKGKEGKSVMEVSTGTSYVQFEVPKKIELTTECALHIKSKIAEVEIPFNTVNVTPTGAADMIEDYDGDTSFVVLDVRTSEEYDGGHVENAINVDYYGTDFETELNELDKTKTYLVYCGSGKRSALAVAKMQELGFTSLYNMLEGITGLQKVAPDLITK